MGPEFQHIAAISIVALAGAYVLWSMIAQFRGSKKGCGSACSGCVANEKSLGEAKAFVGIDALSQPPK
jgi:hypothetical protein